MSFYDELSRYYDIIFPLGKPQMEFIEKRLNGSHKEVLDLAAGTGNYSIALAKQGYDVTAIDLDGDMIKKIDDKSKENSLNMKSIKLDMKEINSLNSKFDVMICIGNSIVHLENYNEILNELEMLYNSLNEGGVVIIQIVNYDRILENNIRELPTIDRGEVKFIRKYDYDNSKILFKGKIIINKDDSEDIYENCVELYPLKSEELISGLNKAGFKKIELYGSFNEDEYSIDSFATVVAAYK